MAPDRWRAIAATPLVRLPGDRVALLADQAAGRRRLRGTLIALTDRELVVVQDPDLARGDELGFCVDVVRVPRARLERLTVSGDRVVIRSAGVELERRIGVRLIEALVAELAPCLPLISVQPRALQ
jgi:hypothetical protein